MIVSGITLGFFPASGWVNTELKNSRCYYVSLFPGTLILLNSFLSIIPIILVAVLYTIILIKALKNVREIKASVKIVNSNTHSKPELRIYRGSGHPTKNTQSVKAQVTKNIKLKRSASFNGNSKNEFDIVRQKEASNIFKSSEHLNNVKKSPNNSVTFQTDTDHSKSFESNISIYSINSSESGQNSTENRREKTYYDTSKRKTTKKGPNKWRAIIVVMLTTGSFIFTWMPYFITVIFYVLCQEKLTNTKCMHLRMLLAGPLGALAFLNSILNPLIYAWWHKGFQKSIKMYLRRYIYRIFQKDVLR